jgi:HEAT repeat protein
MLVSISRTCHPAGMGKKRGILLAVLFVALLGGLAWVLSRPTEPVYQGKPLSAWLKDFYYGWDEDTNQAAFVAFREMGTNAVPDLLKTIQSDDPPFQRMISELNRRQSLVHFPLRETWLQREAASIALYAVGTNAKPAFRALTNLLLHTDTLVVGLVSLGGMWSSEERLEERFIQADCPGVLSAVPLAGMGSEGLPPLIAALTNQKAFIRYSATRGLAWERADLNIVVPALIARLNDKDLLVHFTAVLALGRLRAEPELAVPALMKDFPGNDPELRSLILKAIGRFETNARAVVPMLFETLSDSNQNVRIQAASALKQIDPEAAAKAGVK